MVSLSEGSSKLKLGLNYGWGQGLASGHRHHSFLEEYYNVVEIKPGTFPGFGQMVSK